MLSAVKVPDTPSYTSVVALVFVKQALLAALYEPPAEAATTVTVIFAARVPPDGVVVVGATDPECL